MPRPRGSEVSQRRSSRGPPPLKTSSPDLEPLHQRPMTDRSPKLGHRRSPRGPQPDALNQKKLGSRIADLESQLGQAQAELKILKLQLASAEAAKKEVRPELEEKTKPSSVPEHREIQQNKGAAGKEVDEIYDNCQNETDVFEVPTEKKAIEPNIEHGQVVDQVEKESNSIAISSELNLELKMPCAENLAFKDDEVHTLKAGLEEKAKELDEFGRENESLKNQLTEATSGISSAKAKGEEMSLTVSQLEEELEASKASAAQLKEQLGVAVVAKEAMEAEMKMLRVQTEQWRKAADAAAAVLAGHVEMNGRISERCGSMDKQFSSMFVTPAGGYARFVGSPGVADDLEDGFGSGKRRGSGIKMFGDLWRKMAQK